jgi:hypothetical protein
VVVGEAYVVLTVDVVRHLEREDNIAVDINPDN